MSADHETAEDSRLSEALRWLYDHGGAVYEAKNLFRFKSKFAPRWEPMYLVYPESANLARIATTVGIAYLPNGVVATLRGLTAPRPDDDASNLVHRTRVRSPAADGPAQQLGAVARAHAAAFA